ncbi:MAG TPA: carbohydrate ABC transporter permease [Candidatus Limnocylindrales bacterium]|jgi:ABC-type glycerol-3-phosphate transport system permease component|nr:carbohydrate ABC transporter permease [Candidatus Limnocylindrales bacterium]
MNRLTLPGHLARQVFLVLVGAFVLLPIWVLILMATDGSIVGYPSGFHPIPQQPTLQRFEDAFFRPGAVLDYMGLLRNSLLVSVSAAVVALVLGATMAYAFARMRFPGRDVGLVGILLGVFLPPVALAVPLFILFNALERNVPAIQEWGFRDSLLALAIMYAAFAMPVCLWLMRAAFRAVPAELEEAAFVDGATRFTAFRRITLPLATPSILIAALVAFLLAYTEFALAWLFISTNENVTLAMILAEATTGFYTSNWPATAAYALLMAVPVVIVFVVLQRALLQGALATTEAD